MVVVVTEALVVVVVAEAFLVVVVAELDPESKEGIRQASADV